MTCLLLLRTLLVMHGFLMPLVTVTEAMVWGHERQYWQAHGSESTTASCCSRTSSTTRRLPPCGPPLLHPLGLKGNPTIFTKTMLNPTCQWMTVTTQARSTPSCPRPRNLASNLSAKGVATSRVTWATTSPVIWGTRAGPGQHRSQQMTIGQ